MKHRCVPGREPRCKLQFYMSNKKRQKSALVKMIDLELCTNLRPEKMKDCDQMVSLELKLISI